MADLTSGLKGAVEAVQGEADEEPAVNERQIPLFPAERLDDLSDSAAERREQYGVEGRGRGRPPGARNKASTDWMRYLGSRYTSPLVTLAEIRCRPTAQLAEELRCDPKDAAALQIRCADIEAPYWHGKQPVSLKIESERPVIALVDPAAWLDRWDAEHPSGDTLDLSAVRVRDAEMSGDDEAEDRRVMALLDREQEQNIGGTSGISGARMAQDGLKSLENQDINLIATQMLAADGDEDEGADDEE